MRQSHGEPVQRCLLHAYEEEGNMDCQNVRKLIREWNLCANARKPMRGMLATTGGASVGDKCGQAGDPALHQGRRGLAW